MKISKLFHWLFASIMFLPLLVAPIFAIYSNRHTIDSYEVTRDKYQVVDFNQLYKPRVPNRDINYSLTNDYIINLNGVPNISYYSLPSVPSITTINEHYYLLKLDILSNPNNLSLQFDDFNDAALKVDTTTTERLVQPYNPGEHLWGLENLDTNANYEGVSFVFNLFDLTQMFGEGNEPTIADFNLMFPSDYYEYTSSKNVLVKIGSEIFDNTDIGSQFLYSMYITTDKYLNFDKVLNLYKIKEWIDLNVFVGNAPLVFDIVWHYLDYWLLLSIFWLCFDVLIYVPNLAHRWLDKASLE